MNNLKQNSLLKKLPESINEIQKQAFVKIYELALDASWDEITFNCNSNDDLLLERHVNGESKYIMIGEMEDDISLFVSGEQDSIAYNPTHNNLNDLINRFFDDTI